MNLVRYAQHIALAVFFTFAAISAAENQLTNSGSSRVIPAPFESFGPSSTYPPASLLPPNDWELATPQALRKNATPTAVTVTQSDTAVDRYAPIIFTISHNGAYSNPYDPASIKVDALITSPGGTSISLPCFYKSGSSGNSVWEGRFSPLEPGTYAYTVSVTSGSSTQSSVQKTFNSRAATTREGFLHLDQKSPGNLIFDSGKRFRGVGINFGWEGSGITYQTMCQTLKTNESNFFRTWQCPWNMPLEWSSSGVGYYSETSAKKLDDALAQAAANGVYMMLVFDFHGVLWIDADMWGGNNYWPQNPYNSAKGGPCATPNDFFANAKAQQLYKNRLRYIVARWSYHPNIGAWEFFNEVDHDVVKSGCTIAAVSAWHDTMSRYLKTIDPNKHCVNTSISYNEYPSLINVPNLDFMQNHYYGSQSGEGGVTQNFNSECLRYLKTYKKPMIIGEFSRNWESGSDASSSQADYSRILHLGMWRGALSITPIVPMTWWWETSYTKADYPQMMYISRFVKPMIELPGGVMAQKKMTSTPAIEVLGVRVVNKTFFWAHNNLSTTQNSISVTVDSLTPGGTCSIRSYNTSTGLFSAVTAGGITTSGTLAISIGSLAADKDIAYEVTDNQVSGTVTGSTAALSQQPFEISVKNGSLQVSLDRAATGRVRCALYTLQGRVLRVSSQQIPPGGAKTISFRLPAAAATNAVVAQVTVNNRNARMLHYSNTGFSLSAKGLYGSNIPH